MKLELNEEKTKIVDARKESFDFLGFTIRYDKDVYGAKRRYWNIVPSRKSQKKIRRNLDVYLKSHGHSPATILLKDINSKIRGWLNYYEIP